MDSDYLSHVHHWLVFSPGNLPLKGCPVLVTEKPGYLPRGLHCLGLNGEP